MLTLNSPIQNLPRLTPRYFKPLEKIGLKTIRDLLFHFPFRYDNYSQTLSIAELAIGKVATIEGTIKKLKNIRTWKKRMFITEALIADDSGSIRATWFNQPFLMNSLAEGKAIRISGKISEKKSPPTNSSKSGGNKLITDSGLINHKIGGGMYFSNPAWELARRDPTNTGRLVPVYPETAGLTSRWLRWQLQLLLKSDLDLADPLPEEIIERLHLPPLDRALNYIHFPENETQYLLAQKRFAFEEMLLLQLKSLEVRHAWGREKSVAIKFDEALIKKFVSTLPFQLTNAQRKASFQILQDLEKTRPMNRLLNGDVGSGKTIVAAIASLQVVTAGYQVALLAPTEILAQQHYQTLSRILGSYEINIGLLTNSYQEIYKSQIPNPKSQTNSNNKKNDRNNLLSALQGGEINLIIGTHAIIQKDIRFKNLALVIVDEQHRFGVAQRAYLQQETLTYAEQTQTENYKSASSQHESAPVPHFLTMTATPIPRTLALAFFGNLDLSLLDEMPKNRKPIITQIVSPTGRNKVYDFIRSEIKSGRQCFVILPLVEESKILTEVKAATQEFQRLSQAIFPDLKLGLVHGKLKPVEKEQAMLAFKNGETNILVATAVVEVGIDIPNATAMLIEDADRFGLSQLHQFRGRIGRSDQQSYCFLFTQSSGVTAKKRLEALVASADGFAIAEKDLKLRGPGEFFGRRQSGLPDIAMENITNVKLIQIAREEAENILRGDPELKKHPALKKSLRSFGENIHLE